MNSKQMNSWIISGGGYKLYREIYEPFNLIPFVGGNTSMQMGGWFNKEINSFDDLKGLKMRILDLEVKYYQAEGLQLLLLEEKFIQI